MNHNSGRSSRSIPGVVLRIILWLSLPIALLALPLYPLVTPEYVHWQYSKPSFPPSERFTDAERVRLSDVIVNYLRGKASLQQMQEMRTDQGDMAMRDDEVQHIADVKRVMDGFYLAQPITMVLVILAAAALVFREGRRASAGALRTGIWITLGLIIAVVGSSFIDFDVFFDRFHRIFFTGESWLFYYEDTLIQLYPLPFWVNAVWQMGVMIVLELGALFGITYLIQGKTPDTSEQI